MDFCVGSTFLILFNGCLAFCSMAIAYCINQLLSDEVRLFHISVNNCELRSFDTCIRLSSKQTSWNGFAKMKCHRRHKVSAVANLSSVNVVPTCTQPRDHLLPAPSLKRRHQTPHLHSSRGGECYLGTVVMDFSHVWNKCWVFWGHCIFFHWGHLQFLCSCLSWAVEFFLPLLYIGCCWKFALVWHPFHSLWEAFGTAVNRNFV